MILKRKISELFFFADPVFGGVLLTALCGLISLIAIHAQPSQAYYYGMIVVTQAHFAVAYFFFFTSSQVRIPGSWKYIALLLGLSAFFCTVYMINKSLLDWLNVVYLYFAWHLIRDEVFFRRPQMVSRVERSLLALLVASVSFLIYFFSVGNNTLQVLFSGIPDPTNFFDTGRKDYRNEILWIGGAVFIFTVVIFMRFLRKRGIPWAVFYKKYKGILHLFLGFLILSLLVCLFRLNALMVVNSWIIYHVSAWYWYSIQKIRKSSAQKRDWRNWGRSTIGRFNLIYGSVQLAILLAFVFYFYGGAQHTFVKYYFHPRYFNLWTLFHVTLSLFPKRILLNQSVEGTLSPKTILNPLAFNSSKDSRLN